MEEKVYCLERGCQFTDCKYHPFRAIGLFSPFSSTNRKVDFKSLDHFSDDCKLRIRRWIEEMLD